MQACTLLNSFAGSVLVFVLGFAGCSSNSTPPAETPNESASTTPDAPNAESTETPAEAADSNEKWEGEAEATSSGSGSAASSEQEARSTTQIQKQIVENRKPFRDCYDKARKELPDLRGTLTLHFVLDPEGKVKKAELNMERSDIKSASVADCAIAVLKGMTFPPSSRGMETTVNYPFDFKP
ncbi:MAG TPA: AgmX/PglI C-terminal domain-containing protein [Polyangiaceae bacterium]|nr:AgmX/PglI C-terminal domain-containing protein [Polyangiaceae bacterium]